ncbi:P-type ATPase [Boothiomyces sp. JEL0866]|nr:P-type ATPase [Boothiomyces sp. JEL0866]
MEKDENHSVRLDGRASIEHQIDIHVVDLVEAVENPDITVLDILQGLKYVMDYRIANGKMQHLDLALMKRLADGLLNQTGKKTGNLLNQKPTEEADLAFSLFGDFVANVSEFRVAVGEKSAPDLCYKLKIHRRCQPRSTKEQRIAAASILGLLTLRFPQFHDWHDLVDSDEYDDVERLMKEFPDIFTSPAMPVADTLHPPQVLYFDKNSEDLAQMYGSNTTNGLPKSTIASLREYYGENCLPPPPKTSVWKMIWAQLTDFMVLILTAASIIEIIMGDIKAAIVLLTVVLINVVIGVTQEYNANKALEALLTLTVPKASVIRDGVQMAIDSKELVPGDLVVLEEGDAVPADLRLCEVAQLDIIESILTGESLPVSKSIRTIRKRTRKLPLGDCKGNAFMTTVVSRGRGRGIVVRTGTSTEIGKISAAISGAAHAKTNIEKQLSKLGMWLVALAVLLVVIIVVIGLLWKRPTIDMVDIGISLAVSVIPEGLVAVVTIAMALGVTRMAKLNAIVKKLPCVETVGSVNYICSDKTGTLTEGKMGAQRIWTADNCHYNITHSTALDPNLGEINCISSTLLQEGIENNELSQLHENREVGKNIEKIPGPLTATLMVASLCNNSSISKEVETEKWVSQGDPTEVALLVAGYKSSLSRSWFVDEVKLSKLGEYAFDSDRKLMSSVYAGQKDSPKEINSTSFVLVKGAPEAVLKHCTHYITPSAERLKGFKYLEEFPVEPLNDKFVEYISNQSADMASSGLRVLAMAIRKVSIEEGQGIIAANKASAAESNLVFAGFIGLIDPPKAGVKESIALSKTAGIKVVMITGDHVATASAIAKDLGILEPGDPECSRAMKGYEIDLLSEEVLSEQKPFPVVFARVSPDNKLKIVKALQRKGNSVVMTGDGVNDAPAIKQADVGVAMGIAGTEITKQAADMVLANDDFTTIVAAVKEGRQVYDNILKFVVYLLSCNGAEVLLFLFCVSINVDLPFTTIQILWANIFADIPPALSLGLEPAEDDIMERPPRPQNQGVLTAVNSTVIILQALLMSLLTFGVYLLSVNQHFCGADTVEKQESFAFILLTTMQLVQSFLSRSITISVFKTGIIGNKILVFSFFLSFGLMLLGLEVPAIASWLGLVDPGGLAWAVVWICVAFQIVFVEVLKLVIRSFFLPKQEKRGKLMVQIGSLENL